MVQLFFIFYHYVFLREALFNTSIWSCYTFYAWFSGGVQGLDVWVLFMLTFSWLTVGGHTFGVRIIFRRMFPCRGNKPLDCQQISCTLLPLKSMERSRYVSNLKDLAQEGWTMSSIFFSSLHVCHFELNVNVLLYLKFIWKLTHHPWRYYKTCLH